MSEAGSDLFWDSQGLRQIAEIIKSQVGPQAGKRMTQERLCYLAGVGKSNLSLFLKNVGNSNGFYNHTPAPEFLLKIAPHIIDPATGAGFDPAKFLAIAWKLNDRVIVLSESAPPPALPPHLAQVKAEIEAVLVAQKLDLKQLGEALRLTQLAGIANPEAWLQDLLAGQAHVTPEAIECFAGLLPLNGRVHDLQGWAALFNFDLEAIAAQQEQPQPQNGHQSKVKRSNKAKP